MIARPISSSAYIEKLRKLFAQDYDGPLERSTIPEGADIAAFYNRSVNYHMCMVPWIEQVFSLSSADILEIGCGDGAATLPVAMACKHIRAQDISKGAMDGVRLRAKFMGIENIEVAELDPAWARPDRIGDFMAGERRRFDVVLLPAVLEHMLIAERLSGLRRLWELLKPKGIMVVYDTPNRLFPFDQHSTRLPFADWLPEELLFAYADRSPRSEFVPALASMPDKSEALYRFGRGASYHEFDIAIGLDQMRVLADGSSSLLVHRDMDGALGGALQHAFDMYAPHVPRGFARDWLELVIQKRWEKVSVFDIASVRRETLTPHLAAQVLEGEAAGMTVTLPEGTSQLEMELLKHPWSATLLVETSRGEVVRSIPLFNGFATVETEVIGVPSDAGPLRLRLDADARSQGMQAWIVGMGAI